MTEKQRDILEYVRQHIKLSGVPPTYREIAEVFDISTTTVWEHIHALKTLGLIRIKPRMKRSIELIETKHVTCPHCNRSFEVEK